MPKLTDDELGTLLRETFTSKEALVDHLPETTKRRSPVPALLAAAAVVVVLAGVLYGVQRVDRPDPAPPVATAASSEKGEIWGVAVATVVRKFQPAGERWTAVKVFGQAAAMNASDPPEVLQPGVTFTTLDKREIERAVTPIAPVVVWTSAISPETCAPGTVPSVVVDPIVGKGDRREVRVLFMLGCGGNTHSGTYTLEKVDGAWKVTAGTGDLCGDVRSPSASPRAGC
ncbi:hypothetical protein [Kribbella shirazensis]|uniref:Uncharacterized protein n=1 Tax=Kribbella shirazensis TaxID=1105143 RepID=A0A7X5ZYJ6_9ACTN|nr:hypothetical protein [Kribbella shirazensis]NIK54963.1 hypothetical protein [Kribbella shirazensis]